MTATTKAMPSSAIASIRSTDALEQLPGPRKAAWFKAPDGDTPTVEEQRTQRARRNPIGLDPSGWRHR
jgi:hypothetical protein